MHAPPTLKNLSGFGGLATLDPAWEALALPGAEVGLSLVTNGVTWARPLDDQSFPDAEGFRRPVGAAGKATYELQDSDVVCFRSGATDDEGHHTLIQVTENGVYALPPLTMVILDKVEEAGEWEANGHQVRRRLFTVSVTY